MPVAAKDLIVLLLSKRPILRPSLADILTNPWLADYAPHQQAILKLQQPAPFTTQLEKDILERMRNCGVDIDLVIESVLSQRCDTLAGWWSLLLDKQERKERRRLQKRREKDTEVKALRRLSAMSGRSGRMELVAPTIKESPEESSHAPETRDPSTERGRELNRPNGSAALVSTPRKLPEVGPAHGQDSPVQPVTRTNMPRAISASRRRSQLGPGEYRKRNSTLQLVASSPNLHASDGTQRKRKRLYQHPLLNQLALIKHWFRDNAKRAKSPNPKNNARLSQDPAPQRNVHTLHRLIIDATPSSNSDVNLRPDLHARATYPSQPRLSTHASTGSARRLSHSPFSNNSTIIVPSNEQSTWSEVHLVFRFFSPLHPCESPSFPIESLFNLIQLGRLAVRESSQQSQNLDQGPRRLTCLFGILKQHSLGAYQRTHEPGALRVECGIQWPWTAKSRVVFRQAEAHAFQRTDVRAWFGEAKERRGRRKCQ